MERTKEQTQELAQKLADRLGNGWIPEIYQNLGWHYCVIFGNVGTIYEFGSDNYWADLRTPIGYQYESNGSTPHEALNKALNLARVVKAQVEQLLDTFKS